MDRFTIPMIFHTKTGGGANARILPSHSPNFAYDRYLDSWMD